MVCIQREHQSAKIRNVFTQRQLPVAVQARQYLDVFVLTHHLRCSLLELRGILSGPPIAKCTGCVAFASLVVEQMNDFMSNHAAKATVIYSGICQGIEVGRL